MPPLASSNLPSFWRSLHQVGRDRRQVHRHEGTGPAVAAGVDVAGQHFLSSAALAGHQHRDGLGGDLLRHLHHRAHLRRGAQHQGPADVRSLDVVEPLELAAGAKLGQRLAHAGDQLGRREVLGDVIEGAGVHCLHRDGDVLQHRAHDHTHVGVPLAHDPQRLEPAHPRHLHVEQYEVERGGAHPLQRFLAGGGEGRLHRTLFQDEMDVLAQVGVVVDDQDVRHPGHQGDSSILLRLRIVSTARTIRRAAMIVIHTTVSTLGVLNRSRKWKLASPPATYTIRCSRFQRW